MSTARNEAQTDPQSQRSTPSAHADLPVAIAGLERRLGNIEDSLSRFLAVVDGQSRPPGKFLSVSGAAAYCSLSEDSIRTLIARGDLIGLRPLKGRILIDRVQLDQLILGSTRRPTAGRGIRLRRGGKGAAR